MTNVPMYSLRSDGDQWRISKFVDGDVESSYLCSETACECPAGHRHTCRHRQMLPMMLAHGIADTHWFYLHDAAGAIVDFNGNLKRLYDELADQTKTNTIQYAINHIYSEEDCPGHIASDNNPMICGRCGIHIDSLRPDSKGLAEEDTMLAPSIPAVAANPMTDAWGPIAPEEIGRPIRINLPPKSWRRM